jgi:hypothetical protein
MICWDLCNGKSWETMKCNEMGKCSPDLDFNVTGSHPENNILGSMQRETMKCNEMGKMKPLMGQLTQQREFTGTVQFRDTLTEHREGLEIMRNDLIQQDMETHRNHGRYFNSTGYHRNNGR